MSLCKSIETEALACGYDPIQVLSHVDFSLEPGQAVALLGPNGCGKSTLLKTLSKSLRPMGGQVLIQGDRLDALSFPELAQRIAYVPQEEPSEFRFSVQQIVLMGRLADSHSFFDSREDLRIAEEAMKLCDCFHLKDRPITQVSAGEKQRALIARALAQQAEILLLDEPTAHLDVGHQIAIARLLSSLCAKGHAVLAALHDLNLGAAFADRAILLGAGTIAAAASYGEVLESPVLDKVYGVTFERIKDSGGRLRVLPKL
ncbi:MAG: iron ABC transporter ATP-binding protein [Armatimonadota bacterium]|nr:MAG: iron ABC transporter ATP-binding protein [Armatimonadota bacterium]